MCRLFCRQARKGGQRSSVLTSYVFEHGWMDKVLVARPCNKYWDDDYNADVINLMSGRYKSASNVLQAWSHRPSDVGSLFNFHLATRVCRPRLRLYWGLGARKQGAGKQHSTNAALLHLSGNMAEFDYGTIYVLWIYTTIKLMYPTSMLANTDASTSVSAFHQ